VLRSALPCIPADDRGIWIKVLAALKTLEPAWGSRARKIADWWSKKSSKFDPVEQEKAWKSLDDDRPGGVSILTLFYLAREYGWVDPRRVTGGTGERARSGDDDREAPQPDTDPGLKINSFIRGDAGNIVRGQPQNTRFSVHKLGIRLRLNEFSTQTEISGLPKFEGELTDAGAIRLRFLVHEAFGFMPPANLFHDVLIDIAHCNRFHPVRDYLSGLSWDGVPRIDTWLIDYAGAEDTPFNRAVGLLFLIAGVRRIRQPGIKFDTMPVLESPQQGKNKSQALLACHQGRGFTDNLPLGADPKEVIEQISGNWIVEFPKLSGMATRERERITSFLSRQVDKARPAYGHRRESVPRQFVACGTTNDDEWLPRDERRIWPVRITLFDLKALARDLDQLWAEAAHHEAAGVSITLDEALWAEAEIVRAVRLFANPYQSILVEALGKETTVPAKRVWAILDILPDRLPRESRRIGSAMIALGFTRKRTRRDGEPAGCKRGDYYYERENVP
jgi:Virulence-associated protein E/Primase C terminal 2 (PriCT-2)